MKILVTGAAGFIGYHLCKALLAAGNAVLGADNFYTGNKKNVDDLAKHAQFSFVEWDVRQDASFDLSGIRRIYHLACPASPPHYQRDPLFTLDTCYLGTRHVLEMARAGDARILIASTSEVYGDAEVHPQNECYKGSVNTWGPRACYDEGKRIAETLAFEYQSRVQIRVARIFNTYGPRMNVEDGRVMTSLIVNALKGAPMPIYGSGKQTRSFCFISDQVRGLVALMQSDCTGPINIGNPEEVSILDVAKIIKDLARSSSVFEFHPLPQDDPQRRCPDISRASAEFHWSPVVSLKDGLKEMIRYYDALIR